MKTLFTFAVLISITQGLAIAGEPFEDPGVYYTKRDFEAAAKPTLAQLQLGKKWVCSELSALPGDFTFLKHQRSYIFTANSGMIKNSGAADVKTFTLTDNGPVGSSSGIESLIRFSEENSELIVEKQILSEAGPVLAGYSVCRIHAEEGHSCGTNGTIEERIEHCNSTKTSLSGVMWKLVTRTAEKSQVWQDQSTGLFWSDYAGSSTHEDAQTSCAEDSLVEAKGGLQEISWHLPSLKEVKKAGRNGMRGVLPNMPGHFFWTQSKAWSFFKKRDDAWGFFGHSGVVDYFNRKVESSFRCVGR